MIVTHSDLDGFVSALAVMHMGIGPTRVAFFNYEEDRDTQWELLLASELEPQKQLITSVEDVWFTDLSLMPGELEWARDKRKRNRWHWVDHQASEQFDPEGIFDEVLLDTSGERCAADIIWDARFKDDRRGIPVLEAWVRAAHDRDLWINEDHVLNLGLDMIVKTAINNDPVTVLSEALGFTPQEIVKLRTPVIRAEMLKYEQSCRLAENTLERVTIEKIPVILCYVSGFASDVGETLYKSGREILAMVNVAGDRVNVAFRTGRADINLGELAQFFEGGGHPQAAGGRMLEKHLRGGYTAIKRDIQRFLKKR